MTTLVVRTADHADLPRLLDLYIHLNPDDARCSPEDAGTVLDHLLRYDGSVVLVGAIGEALVTTCTLVVIPNLTRGGKPYALIENVVTHADHRGMGFGQTVLRAAVERAWEARCYKVMLMTGSKKPSTLAFYEAAGFEQSKTGFQVRRAAVRPE
ncbi:GNAT family N-acetyltransferase [Methylobacterium sp. SyP6R]|uniref:GNAT family N-acetyltransferase n=1 Tax=Methylobacterium sp. SyP6R TaxID=2718876 RepID=UPI001F00ADB8|nr:GNAT family N-acetyltransferase [Methylobacterium sp. SyP6R]MCF4130111.1 GNAT family N-acetyltransferase [Methylobacterium sp. SyP6R]